MIGQQDANNNLTSRLLLAGTGYNGATALVVKEYHPDGGVVANGYDIFGNVRDAADALNRHTGNSYDALGHLTQVNRASGLIDYYTYDVLGQRTKHSNSFLFLADGITHDFETTDYDVQGRVASNITFGGDLTTMQYSWSATTATTGLGTFGAYTQTTIYANNKQLIEVSDAFGHAISKTDLGNNVTATSYDTAGRIVGRSVTASGASVADPSVYAYLNTGLVSSATMGIYGDPANQDTFNYTLATYSYDAGGNKLTEVTTRLSGGWTTGFYDDEGIWNPPVYQTSGNTVQNAVATYDALGRIQSWSEASTSVTPAASKTWTYDAVGNVRHLVASYYGIDANGVVSGTQSSQNYWYLYDSFNRLATSKGTVSGSQIVRGTTGTDILYDAAGQRVRTTSTMSRTILYGRNYVTYVTDEREDYTYKADGQLDTVSSAEGAYNPNTGGAYALPATDGLRANFTYDGMGRLTHHVDWLGDGNNAGYDRTISYNGKSQITDETVIYQASPTPFSALMPGKNVIHNEYGAGSIYALGSVTSVTTTSYTYIPKYSTYYQSGVSTTNTTYGWYDGATQIQVDYQENASSSWGHTYYTYSGTGVLAAIDVQDGRPRLVGLTNDANGQVIRRDESDQDYSHGDPHEVWYRFNGKQLGYVGNNGTLNTNYDSSVYNRPPPGASSPAFRSGTSVGSADFDQNLNNFTSYSQGSGGGTYTVNTGDTLSSIAAQLWGDSSLWYKLAEANGLSASSALVDGQTLVIPAGVIKSGNNSSTFRPYNVNDAFGDSSPTTPIPQAKKGGCGIIGAILLVVIAVAIVAIAHIPISNLLQFGTLTAPTATVTTTAVIGGLTVPVATASFTVAAGTAATIAGGAIAGALGSIVSQAVGVATGIQDNFSWKGVALAAIGGGIGGGLGKIGFLNNASGVVGHLQDFARGAIGNAATQGIAVATHLQKSFDWAGVAVGGVVGGTVGAIHAPSPGGQLLTGAAGALAGAATRTLIDGSDFGDNLLAALPDVIGSTIGNALTDAVRDAVAHSAAITGEAAKLTDIQRALVDAQGNTSADARAAADALLKDDRYWNKRQSENRHDIKSWIKSGERPPSFNDLIRSAADYENHSARLVEAAWQPWEDAKRIGTRFLNWIGDIKTPSGSTIRQDIDSVSTTVSDWIDRQQRNASAEIDGIENDIVVLGSRLKKDAYAAGAGIANAINHVNHAFVQFNEQERQMWDRQARIEDANLRYTVKAVGGFLSKPLTRPIARTYFPNDPQITKGMMIAQGMGYGPQDLPMTYQAPITNGEAIGHIGTAASLLSPLAQAARAEWVAARAARAAEEAGPLIVSPRNAVSLDEFKRLNVLDSDVGRLRPGEASAAVELQTILGGKLKRVPPGGTGDFIFTDGPQYGKTVDFLLTPGTLKEANNINRYFDKVAESFPRVLSEHLDKADIVPIDSRFLTPKNQEILMNIVRQQLASAQSRIIIYR